jgi:hypothetical protein
MAYWELNVDDFPRDEYGHYSFSNTEPSVPMPRTSNATKHPIWNQKLNHWAYLNPTKLHKPQDALEYLERLVREEKVDPKIHGKTPGYHWVLDNLKPLQRPPSDDGLPVGFPESFRSRTVLEPHEDKDGDIYYVSKENPPLVPMDAAGDTLHLIKELNERGYRRPSIRLAKNYYLIRQQVSADEVLTPDQEMTLIYAACLLSYCDTVDGHDHVKRYVEYFMAYKAWRSVDSEGYRVFKEAQRGREQVVGSTKADLSEVMATYKEGLGIRLASRSFALDIEGPIRFDQIPGGAVFTQYPAPELLKEILDEEEESPTYGQTILMPFFHPATESPRGMERHAFVFPFHLDPYDKVQEEKESRG